MAPAPAPASDCECADPGWTLELSALYMFAGSTEGNSDDPEPDEDFGYRASLAYETPDGLILATRYFTYDGELDGDSDELDITNWDFLIGDRICCSDKLALTITAGLRYAEFEEEGEADIDGFGPVIGIEAQRSLGGPWSLYAGVTQSFILGDDAEEEYDNVIYGMTEIAAGVQYSFAMGPVSDAYVRLGGEGQYYYGASDGDTQDAALFGGVLAVGFDF